MTPLVITFYYKGKNYMDKIYWCLLKNKLITIIRRYKDGKILFLTKKGNVIYINHLKQKGGNNV
jgi:hypothetical protein